jgi:hypothetical protein
MDQVKNILAVIKKHHFWILCGLAVLIGLGMSIGAQKQLLKRYEEDKGSISSVQGQIQQVASGSDLPNQVWVDHDKKETDAGRLDVYKAWEKLYQDQVTNVFQWPKDLTEDAEFLKEFAAADDQTEKKLNRTKLNELGDRYMNYITKVALPHLATIIDAEWTITDDKDKESGAGRRSGIGTDGAAVADSASHKVIWDPADEQQKVDNYDWADRPSRLDMQYTQEELWVMEALFKAIQRANSNAKGSYDAAVRKLDEVLVGYDATNRFPLGEGTGRIIRMAPTATAGPGGQTAAADTSAPAKVTIEARRPNRHDGVAGTGTGYTQTPRLGSRDSSAPTTGRGGGSGFDASAPASAEGATDATAWLKDGRYVNAKCEPLSGSDLQNSTTPEFKLMAFRLKLVVDEAQYPRIIEELASSVLPIEVREVRILPGGETAQNVPASRPMPNRGGGSGHAVPAGGPRERAFDSSAPTTGRSSRPFQAPRANAAAAETGTGQHNLPLEIYGVAYLIERPDRKKLNLPETDSGATAATAPATTAQGAAATTTGTTTSPDASAPTGTTPAAAASTTTTTTAPPATAPPAATTEPAAPTNGAETKGNSTGPAPAAAPAKGPADVAPK